MIVTNITPSIRVEKQSGIAGMDMYIEYGEDVIVTETSGDVTKGFLCDFELSSDEEADDILVIKTESGDLKEIGISYITDIDSL
ncbi:MAG: hypothetical protein SOH50_01490 [Leuconostoc mesenteroides]|jgi:hypothetical protein|uniref:hypothetical protein n=2 Tax=Leuconostoc mesenteroides TaxID=1245 RepID=UPI000E09DA34|nr:hypothetical protein [Leuconostoc mesenteroides]MCM6827912.1 hypothetical protein [Leuconostoc mesenteroides]RDF88249.1 hypothetical protein DQM10_08485 [Leuconostoc mesenteroides subsp. mesenteroides]